MSPPTLTPNVDEVARGRVSRTVWHAAGLVLAAAVAWVAWRGYQNPDLLLDLSTLRFC